MGNTTLAQSDDGWLDTFDLKQIGIATDLASDRDRLARIMGSGIDLGAYERPLCLDEPSPADLNDDGVVDFGDLLLVLSSFGPCGDCEACPYDLTGTCEVDFDDVLFILSHWGACDGAEFYGITVVPLATVMDCVNAVGWDAVLLARCVEAVLMQSGE